MSGSARITSGSQRPGTKAYTLDKAKALSKRFAKVDAETVLTHGDLLSSDAGQHHRVPLLSLAHRIWPRGLIRRVLPRHGLFLLMHATK